MVLLVHPASPDQSRALPFIHSYGNRRPDGGFTERVKYTLEGVLENDDMSTPELRALKHMSYWQSTYMPLEQALAGLKTLEDKVAFVHYFLIASSQNTPVVTVEERNKLMKILIEQCSADEVFLIGSKLRSHQPLFSMSLLEALYESLQGVAVVPEKICDIFAKLSDINIQSGYTLFPMNRYYIPPRDVNRPEPYRTFLSGCRERKFRTSFFTSGGDEK